MIKSLFWIHIKKYSLNNILQNSINYIPNLEIIRIKKNFQNLLNP